MTYSCFKLSSPHRAGFEPRLPNLEHLPHKTAVHLPSREVSNIYSLLMDGVSSPLILFCDTVLQSPTSRKKITQHNLTNLTLPYLSITLPYINSMRPSVNPLNPNSDKHRPAMRAEPTKCWFVSKRKQVRRA